GDIEYGGNPGATQDTPMERTALGRLRNGEVFEFAPLAAAETELASIERQYEAAVPTGKAQILRGSEATETVFREHAVQYEWVQVITHGFFAPPAVLSRWRSAFADESIGYVREAAPPKSEFLHPGLLSGLALAGANRAPAADVSDGILTAME